MIIAGTGHRPDKLGGYTPGNPTEMWVRRELEIALIFFNPTTVISGMAIGVDQWLAEEAIKLSIPVVAAIPFLGQEALWPAASKEAYRNILSHCTSSIIVCPGPYASWKMQKRNEWMVDRCDILLAVWNRKEEGGTWNTVKYARSQNRTIQIHYITPPEKPL